MAEQQKQNESLMMSKMSVLNDRTNELSHQILHGKISQIFDLLDTGKKGSIDK